ncbi:PmoA family protein [Microbacterium sp. CIAB417]|uniref:DUF6807 domain-containing protein n=1 Tax=Microbacterium sp. CIAB417 TaxID=2860287 RepID=UPI001FADD792|nr:PmoA family protein [Microbacterium sp. CIAB417]
MSIELLRSGSAVVEYHDGSGVDPLLSPRPYLLATTPSGVPVSDREPEDHRHHLGLSAAFPDVDGTTFWGGRTYVRDRGPTLLANHGTQRVQSRSMQDGTVTEHLAWLDAHGEVLLEEERTISARAADGVWEIAWTSELRAADRIITFGSPQTNGREGAFYGGLFWRAPFPSARVRTADGDGVAHAHGSRSSWIALDAGDAALVAVSTNGMPWFVRAEGYVGFGPAIAVDGRRRIEQGESLRLDLTVSVSDRAPADPADVAETLLAGMRNPV